jgi:hypothetical protein
MSGAFFFGWLLSTDCFFAVSFFCDLYIVCDEILIRAFRVDSRLTFALICVHLRDLRRRVPFPIARDCEYHVGSHKAVMAVTSKTICGRKTEDRQRYLDSK